MSERVKALRKRTREKEREREREKRDVALKSKKVFFYREFHYAIDGSVEHESYSLIDPSPLSVSRSREKKNRNPFWNRFFSFINFKYLDSYLGIIT